jgi:hypothetical protein
MPGLLAKVNSLRCRHSRWVYLLPILQFVVCALALSGYVIPALQPLGIVFEFLWFADLPISVVAFILVWHHGVLAMIWMVIVGTLWWFLLSLGAEALWNRLTDWRPSRRAFCPFRAPNTILSPQFRAIEFPLHPTSNPLPQSRIDSCKPDPMPLSKIAKRIPFVFSLTLLASTLFPSPSSAQLKGDPKSSPLETLPATTLPVSARKVLAVILPKALDAKKIKPGDTFTAFLAAPDFLPSMGSTTQAALVIRVIDAHPDGDNSGNSSLVLRFEPPGSNSASAAPLRLQLQSVAAPSTFQWSPSPIIVDRFPCDPKVSRKGCNNEDNDDDVESQLDKPSLSLCNPARTKDKSRAPTCDDFNNSHGIYGYPDLSLSPPAADSANTSTIISTKKNLKLESGTILILSGPDAAIFSKHFSTPP